MAGHALASVLVTDVLDSFEKLEVVVQLARSAQPLTADALAASAGIAEDRVAEAIDDLVRDGVVTASSRAYQIATGGPWAAHVRELSDLYRDDRMQVVTLMSNAALERMRARALRAFADAFVIGSRKKGDPDG